MNRVQILSAIVFILSLSACSEECDDIKVEYQLMQANLAEKRAEAKELSSSLEAINIEDPEQVSGYMLIEDELVMVLIDVAVLEINIEDFEKDYSRCL